jgi:SMI1 / KNR4 family (SUKH-1)
MPALSFQSVSDNLAYLRRVRPPVFGGDYHGFELNSVIAEDGVKTFEHRHSISLPSEYRDFLTQIGNGGAGPYYGIFSLGTIDKDFGFRIWRANDDLVGDPSKPFRFEDAWNDTSARPPDDLLDRDQTEYWRQTDVFEKTYWSSELVNGALPICHQGCALRILLVVTGPESGKLWDDRRSEFEGIRPLKLADGSQATFGGWYSEWLEQCIAAAKSN